MIDKKEKHKLYCRDWREKFSKLKKAKVRKKQREYFYEHREEHRIRTKNNYHNNLERERAKQKIRVYSQLHKKEILSKFNNKCAICRKKPKNLEFHHISYNSKNRFKNVLPLCRECHINLHKSLRRKND